MIRIEERTKDVSGVYQTTQILGNFYPHHGESIGFAYWVMCVEIATHPHRYGPHGTHRLVILDLSGSAS